MKQLVIKPIGFPLPLRECPPGHFTTIEWWKDGLVYLKTEYYLEPGFNKVMAFCDSGEYCHIDNDEEVIPCEVIVEEVEV